jgi:hypothetical protein
MIGILLLTVNWHDLRTKARVRAERTAAVKALATARGTKKPEAALV